MTEIPSFITEWDCLEPRELVSHHETLEEAGFVLRNGSLGYFLSDDDDWIEPEEETELRATYLNYSDRHEVDLVYEGNVNELYEFFDV